MIRAKVISFTARRGWLRLPAPLLFNHPGIIVHKKAGLKIGRFLADFCRFFGHPGTKKPARPGEPGRAVRREGMV